MRLDIGDIRSIRTERHGVPEGIAVHIIQDAVLTKLSIRIFYLRKSELKVLAKPRFFKCSGNLEVLAEPAYSILLLLDS